MEQSNEDMLYGDLVETAKAAEISDLQEILTATENKNENLTQEVVQLKAQISSLVEDRKQIEINLLTI